MSQEQHIHVEDFHLHIINPVMSLPAFTRGGERGRTLPIWHFSVVCRLLLPGFCFLLYGSRVTTKHGIYSRPY